MEWVSKALKTMRDIADQQSITCIAVPRIAAGLGGLEWNTVKDEIESIYAD
jgi:O-acetyl-ADP-ribose deacetylase (regulator of RNase III)